MFSIKDKILCNERATPALSVLNMKIKSNTSSTLINKHRILIICIQDKVNNNIKNNTAKQPYWFKNLH